MAAAMLVIGMLRGFLEKGYSLSAPRTRGNSPSVASLPTSICSIEDLCHPRTAANAERRRSGNRCK